MKTALADIAIKALYHTGFFKLFAPTFAGLGTILTFHRVKSPRPDAFQPNRGLEVTPEFFQTLVLMLKAKGFEFLTVSEVHRRLTSHGTGRRFVCLTFDDGYRDNYEELLPLCRKLGVPFTVYVTTGFVENEDLAWWIALERLIADSAQLDFAWSGQRYNHEIATDRQKYRAFEAMGSLFISQNRASRRSLANVISEAAGIDLASVTAGLCMTRDMVRELDASGFCEVGAHTVSHSRLSSLPSDKAVEEMINSRTVLQEWLGHPVRHFAYPFGQAGDASAREYELARIAGFSCAVTTRNGNLMHEHADRLWSLPRIEISGRRQKTGAAEVLMSGAASALTNGFKRVAP